MTVCALASGFRFLNQSAYVFFLFFYYYPSRSGEEVVTGRKMWNKLRNTFQIFMDFCCYSSQFYSGFPSGNKPHVHINIFLFIDNLFFIYSSLTSITLKNKSQN